MHNARKCSREDMTTDLMNILLVSSDPLISSLRKDNKAKKKDLHPDALELLNDSEDNFEKDDSESSCEE